MSTRRSLKERLTKVRDRGRITTPHTQCMIIISAICRRRRTRRMRGQPKHCTLFKAATFAFESKFSAAQEMNSWLPSPSCRLIFADHKLQNRKPNHKLLPLRLLRPALANNVFRQKLALGSVILIISSLIRGRIDIYALISIHDIIFGN